MTAAPKLDHNSVDPSPTPGSRAELQLASVASGLLLLLDAHRLTGRLPLEIQVQVGRLRHAVKVAIQAQATSQAGVASPPVRGELDAGAALRSWIAAQPWAQPGPQAGSTCSASATRPPVSTCPCRGRAAEASTPATTGAGPRTWSAASPSTATPPGPAPAASSRSP